MLTQRMQIQVVAGLIDELLRGPGEVPPGSPAQQPGSAAPRRTRAYRAADFMEPYDCIWAALEELRPMLAGQPYQARLDGVLPTLLGVLSGCEDGHSIYRSIASSLPAYQSELFPLTTQLAATYRPPDWLWEGWLPTGVLSMLGAAAGIGKTYVALDLARRIIAGDVFPDGSPVPPGRAGRDVVYVDAEGIPGALIQRLSAWDMDLDRLHFLLPPGLPGGARTGGRDGPLDFGDSAHRGRFIDMLIAYEPALAVVDSLSMIADAEDVGEALAFLKKCAERFDCAILLIHYGRRRRPLLAGQELTLDDLRWPSYLVGQARSVLGMALVQEGPEPDRNGPRRLEVIKANFCPNPPALGLRFQPMAKMCARLVYGPPPQKHVQSQQPREACAAWLAALLGHHADGLPPKEIIARAAAAGYTRSAVYRARDLLGARVESTGRHKHQIWRLVSRQLS